MIFWALFSTFFTIGAFTFGGGYAMLPLIRQAVAARGWLTAEELLDFIAVSESTPGPFAVNIATYVGVRTAGLAGALCATLGVVLPSFLVILLVARAVDRFRKSRWVEGCLSGLRPAVVGLIASALAASAATVFFPAGLSAVRWDDPALWLSAGILAVSLLLIFRIKLHPIAVLCLCAALGVAGGYALHL